MPTDSRRAVRHSVGMATARALIVQPGQLGHFHVVVRCVQQLFLCGRCRVSGRNYDHRRGWIETRILELGELFAIDALHRNESCGGHFREESVEEDGEQKGEAKRDDKNFAYVAAREYKGYPKDAVMHKEELTFNDIELKQRSYK